VPQHFQGRQHRVGVVDATNNIWTDVAARVLRKQPIFGACEFNNLNKTTLWERGTQRRAERFASLIVGETQCRPLASHVNLINYGDLGFERGCSMSGL